MEMELGEIIVDVIGSLPLPAWAAEETSCLMRDGP